MDVLSIHHVGTSAQSIARGVLIISLTPFIRFRPARLLSQAAESTIWFLRKAYQVLGITEYDDRKFLLGQRNRMMQSTATRISWTASVYETRGIGDQISGGEWPGRCVAYYDDAVPLFLETLQTKKVARVHSNGCTSSWLEGLLRWLLRSLNRRSGV